MKRRIGVSILLLMTAAGACGLQRLQPFRPEVVVTSTRMAGGSEFLATASATKKPTPTATLLPAWVFTPVPTLGMEQARERLLELLSGQANCRLPCLWGITPGKSTLQDVRPVVEPLRILAGSPIFWPDADDWLGKDGIGVDLVYTEDAVVPTALDGGSVVRQTFFMVDFRTDEQGVVRHISFKAMEEDEFYDDAHYTLGVKHIYDSASFGERLRPYMLSSMLAEYGMPEEVLISTYGPPKPEEKLGYLDIVLLYPDQGIFAHYTTVREVVDGKGRACPANAHVVLELFPVGDRGAFLQGLAAIGWGELLPPPDNVFWRSLERATSLSLEEFYETFRESGDACLETPIDLWWVPDR